MNEFNGLPWLNIPNLTNHNKTRRLDKKDKVHNVLIHIDEVKEIPISTSSKGQDGEESICTPRRRIINHSGVSHVARVDTNEDHNQLTPLIRNSRSNSLNTRPGDEIFLPEQLYFLNDKENCPNTPELHSITSSLENDIVETTTKASSAANLRNISGTNICSNNIKIKGCSNHSPESFSDDNLSCDDKTTNDDEGSILSFSDGKEVYESAILKIARDDGGLILLEYHPSKDEFEIEKKDDSSHLVNQGETKSKNTSHDKENLFVKENVFQLTSSNYQAIPTDHQSIKLDIPDLILARLNEVQDKKIRQEISCPSDQQHCSPSSKFPSKFYDTNEGRSGTEHDCVSYGRKLIRVKSIRLCEGDEIHASPCQCALKFVGMPMFNNNTQSKGNDDCGFGRHFFGLEQVKNKKPSRTNPKLLSDVCKHPVIRWLTKASNNPDSNNNNDNFSEMAQIASSQEMSNVVGKAKIATEHEIEATWNSSNEQHLLQVQDSCTQFGVKRPMSDIASFTSLGYHEVTLIRNHSRRDISKKQKKVDHKRNFVDWEAITIRCSNHDEMDRMIQDLKSSSDATVVPFSQNAKAELKKRRARKLKKGHDATTSKHGKNCNSQYNSGRESDIFVSKANKCNTLPDAICFECNGENIPEKNEDISLNESRNKKKISLSPKSKKKKKDLNFKFNKNHYCELCLLQFTLLKRRHHCRKCERSCCSSCSSVMLISGGDERRYCNRCNAEMLQQQSRELHRRFGNHHEELTCNQTLPGKVHPSCYKLGVGVIGKLPHWKSFLKLKASNRPAVGWITVEAIEAMALPTFDLVNAKVDPYVRATITGYDRDMKWILREWLPFNRYFLCGGYCSSTLSPQWRGRGCKGGELLTLPVISTAGAVLRLEVLHYNVMGKDVILGTVEIPLSDLPNANSTNSRVTEASLEGKKSQSDGFCERWYRLLSRNDMSANTINLSKPIENPHLKQSTENKIKENVGIKSLEEIAKRIQGVCIAPVEWLAAAIKLDLPTRRPEVICKQHLERSVIHVRIKLNASEFGDMISHVFFPPVQPYPPIPPFDPQLLFSNIVQVVELTKPYREIIRFIEDVLKWKQDPKVCTGVYIIFALHLALLTHILPVFHIYLFVFLCVQLKKTKKKAVESINVTLSDNNDSEYKDIITDDYESDVSSKNTFSTEICAESQSDLQEVSSNIMLSSYHTSSNLPDIMRSPSLTHHIEDSPNNADLGVDKNVGEEVDSAKLNKAVSWLAKRLWDNKGLEVLQFKLSQFGKGVHNLNIVWNGTRPLLTQSVMFCIAFSFFLHLCFNRRLLWLCGSFLLYFAQSPITILVARMMLGFWRGLAKITRRQHLHDAEVAEVVLKII